MKLIRLTLIGIVLLAAGWLVANSRAATETPDYQVVEKEGNFEIRDYPQLKTVTTPMGGEKNDDRSFKKLFGFITGANEREENISMTAPVLIDREAPETSMSFILPKETAEKGAPEPERSDVKLATRSAGRFAAIRFEGKGTREEEDAAEQKLRSWIKERGLTVTGEPVVAYYDPPWTPAGLRRNEVLIPVAK